MFQDLSVATRRTRGLTPAHRPLVRVVDGADNHGDKAMLV